jgi:hypothetical protein
MDATKKLESLLLECWKHYDQAHECVVKPSIPIMFFGDYKKYFDSKLRVITVGLNPSDKEFPKPSEDCFKYFPDAKNLVNAEKRDCQIHLQSLSRYFKKEEHYSHWFKNYECALKGMESSYYNNRNNAALHTDFCSPLATKITWSNLDQQTQSQLEESGRLLWHSLVEILEPDIILASIRCSYADNIFPTKLESQSWQIIWSHPSKKKSLDVHGRIARITPAKCTLVVTGGAAQTPFGVIKHREKQEMGNKVFEWYCKTCKNMSNEH